MALQDSLEAYYVAPAVRARMVEFLGGSHLEEATCHYITSRSEDGVVDAERLPPGELDQCMLNQRDIGRSLWDKESLIVDIDIEYVNFDHPIQPYLIPERIFKLQEVVERTLEQLMARFGLRPLHLISGRGHHFMWRVARGTPAHAALEAAGWVPDFLEGFYGRQQPVAGISVPRDTQQGFAGLALLMEYVAHLLKRDAAPYSELPVELTAVEVGPGYLGREMISVDISEYGDPVSLRSVRVPFSAYLKPWQQREALGDRFVDRLLPMFLVPLHEMSVAQALEVMRDPDLAAELASRISVQIPEQGEATLRLLEEYNQSSLRTFHEHFYAQEHDPPEIWPETYDQAPLELLPLCVRHILEHPNELLLKPAGLEQVVRAFLALGWHPRHIAGLIRSKYERDFGWGRRWLDENAGVRADFYTRIFAGLIYAGQDDVVDFNCQSAQERGFCFQPHPSCNLELFRNSILERRKHERLASGPVNRLFLPDEHL